MNKQVDESDFMMCFFDCDIPEPSPDLAAKKDNIKYADSFTIFKVEKVGTNAIRKFI